MHVAVIGGGWAGLAAAVSLAGRDVPVTLFEASRELGGRARRVTLDGIELDNGQHILIGAYRTTLALMRQVGVDPQATLSRTPLALRYADGFALQAPKIPYPFNLAAALATASGLRFADAVRAVSFLASLRLRRFRVDPDRPVAEWLAQHGQEGRLRSHLWEPLCVSALNTPADRASAQVFAYVLEDALTGTREASDLLIPRVDLGKLFPQPAADYIRRRGGSIELGAAVRKLSRDADGFRVDGRAEAFSHVVVATAPQHAVSLLEPFSALDQARALLNAFAYEPITTCYLSYGEDMRLSSPMLGMADGLVQWLFDRGQLGGPAGLLAAVISGSGAHDALANAVLGERVHEDLTRYLADLSRPRWTRVIAERRATFSCRPGLARPDIATAQPGLLLCGDYLDGRYPGTLESATRCGVTAADWIIARR